MANNKFTPVPTTAPKVTLEVTTPEAAPLVTASDVVVEPVKETPVPVVVAEDPKSQSALILSHYIANYKKLVNSPSLPDPILTQAAQILYQITNLVLTKKTNELYDAYYAFLDAEKADLMSERKALRGISFLEKAQHTKVSLLYTAFYNKISKSASAVDYRTVGDQLGVEVVTYLKSKK